jgi:hypothetical protein
LRCLRERQGIAERLFGGLLLLRASALAPDGNSHYPFLHVPAPDVQR